MRTLTHLVVIAMLAGAVRAGELPSLPGKPDYAIVDSLAYPGADDARSAWKPMAGTADGCVVKVGQDRVTP